MSLQTTVLVMMCLVASGCASTTTRGKNDLNAGMTIEQVRKTLGSPDDRSFRDNNEALQYHDIVGFGQCEYLTAWFTNGILHSVTTRRGSSVAGCGLGSQPVDWGQMPKPSLDVNMTIN
jgi:hypothetical protein